MHFDQKFDRKFEHYSCVRRTISNASQPSLLSIFQVELELNKKIIRPQTNI